jgi:hypothetical protein
MTSSQQQNLLQNISSQPNTNLSYAITNLAACKSSILMCSFNSILQRIVFKERKVAKYEYHKIRERKVKTLTRN